MGIAFDRERLLEVAEKSKQAVQLWYNFRELQNYLADRGVAVVGSTYLDIWRKELDPSGFEALLDSMARIYSTMYTNMTIDDMSLNWLP